jgi:16S rRNA (cytosine967-C5)-methyltransferase
MQLGARLHAAIEVLDEIFHRHRPASQALSDWGRTHRFAGSGDRSAIGNIVFDALRKRNSLAWVMGADTSRALALGVLAHGWDETVDRIDAMCAGGRTPEVLSDPERAVLTAQLDAGAPDWVRGDYPAWLEDDFRAAFGDDAAMHGAALAERAPVDVRVNTLKADRAKVLRALRDYAPEETPFSPVGVRVPVRARHHKSPKIETDAAHGKGWFEVQDEGSQIAALLAGAAPGQQVADVCAGAGGKTLALAAQMENTGQIYAYDADKNRLRPIFDRLKRAGARNAQVVSAGDAAALEELAGRMDVVLVDAPCSGSGAWRRRPDAKWRLSAAALHKRHAEQRAVLAQAAPLVRPGGRLVYVTCSVLQSENEAQIASFLVDHTAFARAGVADTWLANVPCAFPGSAARESNADTLLLSPATHGTDGFFVAILERIV